MLTNSCKPDAKLRKRTPGFNRSHPKSPLNCVAYFSMEFMLSEALPIYSGGLGNVAGDQLKAASDLGVPVIGVGLLYQQGYFRQVIDRDGAQEALYPVQRPRTIAHHAAAPTERGMVAAAARPARLPDLAARLAGSGWQSETLPSGQQRCGELPAVPGDHQRALRRRAVSAPYAGTRARASADGDCSLRSGSSRKSAT